MEPIGAEGRDAMRGLLGAVSESLGAPMAPPWEAACREVPRHAFLPEKVWVGEDLKECSRGAAPGDWLRHAYADTAVVTQVNDGQVAAEVGERWASCSASAPSIVFRMLDMLDVRPGHRVMEIGTGTGWNAGLLAHRLGPGLVTTIEVDPAWPRRRRAAWNVWGWVPRWFRATEPAVMRPAPPTTGSSQPVPYGPSPRRGSRRPRRAGWFSSRGSRRGSATGS